jgi:steroid delta-isomerase-like uncharacterized protein
MSSTNATLARRWFEEVWTQRRAETVRELLTEESECRSEAGVLRGPDAFLSKMHAPFLGAFPDLTLTVEDTVAEGDRVVVRWLATGTHTGDGLGVAPSGRRVTFRGMTWIRFRDGKMLEGLDCWNQTGLMKSLQEGQVAESITVG